HLIALGDEAAPVETYTALGGGLVADQLAVLSTPAFASLRSGKNNEAGGDQVDLRSLVDQKPEDEVLSYLVEITIEEISKILRIPLEAIDPDEPLSVIGMDSLMGLELRLGFESKFGTELPLLAIGDMSVRALARKLLGDLRGDGTESDDGADAAEALLSIHGAKPE
ncbi:MAG: acyl carrier protein, partial [Devosiaceae bacterium]|nr:acyl carrier protein [Devosiaceae bacterium MH13]